jgi:hypothetical protein
MASGDSPVPTRRSRRSLLISRQSGVLCLQGSAVPGIRGDCRFRTVTGDFEARMGNCKAWQ